jgi:hypothetical protein
MNSFYSILYIKPEPASDEKIAAGLFLNTEKRPAFDYSEKKLKLAAHLIGSDAADSLERMLRNMKKKAAAVSEDKNQIEAFEVNPFTESYFKYLNNYSNNLLAYSNPSENIGDFNRSDYKALFCLLVDKNYGSKKEQAESFKSSVRNKINSSVVSEKMDVFYKVPKKSVKTIYRNHVVDYIGVNGSITSGNSLDMEGNFYNLESKLNYLRLLAQGLGGLAEKMDLEAEGRHVVFYNNPEGDKNEQLLSDALHDTTNPLELKHWDYFEEEEAHIAENSFKKFSDFIALGK